LLLATLTLAASYFAFKWLYPHLQIALPFPPRIIAALLWGAVFLFLLPVAMTMALTWKIKEVVLASVFGTE
jgi:hypothetical protein